MRGSALLACALLACRPRAGARDERWDAGALVSDVPARDAGSADRSPSYEVPSPPWRVRATQGARLRGISAGCAPSRTTERAVAVGEGEGFELVGTSGEDYRVSAEWDAPTALGITALEGFTRVARSREPGVTAVVGWGFVDVQVPVGSPAPVRLDTPAGRLVVTAGRARLLVSGGGPGVEVQTRGAEARFWRVEGGVARAVSLPPRSVRRWRYLSRDAAAIAEVALSDAGRALDGSPDDGAQARASLSLGVASAAALATAGGVTSPCAALAARRDALTTRLLALPR